MRKVINIIGKMLSDQDITCIYSYAIEDPKDLLLDLIEHKSGDGENQYYVLSINNKGVFGHNYKVKLEKPELGVYVLQTIRFRVENYFGVTYGNELILNLDKLIKTVEKKIQVPNEED